MANAIPDSVTKCLTVLKGANSDTEKLAGLFLVTKLVKATECNGYHKKLLFEAIGFPFLKRLLLSPDVPAGCPPQIYKSVAMSVLSAFCHEEEIVTHPQILDNVSVFLDIVLADAEDYAGDSIVINEAYECLQGIAAFKAGQKALIECGAVLKMAAIYSQQSSETNEALNVLVSLVDRFGAAAWGDDIKAYNALINVLSLNFETDHSERKFKLCELLHTLIFHGPKELIVDNVANESWPTSILKGLSDILTSRIGKQQRDPALKLASQMLSTLGPEWALRHTEKPRRFFLLLANLSAVEIRMQLEDRDLNHKMENADLIVACFTTLEICVSFIALDTLELEQKEKQQIFTALKGAFSAVIANLIEISNENPTLNAPKKLLVYSMIRALAAWLAQETTAMREAVYSLLPYMLKIANESFYNFRTRYVSEKNRESTSDPDPSSQIDLLRLLLPALCHLTAEDEARQILLKERLEEVLLECLAFHWSIVHDEKPPAAKSERNTICAESELPTKLLDQMNDSRTAIVSLCNILMNVTVLEAKLVEENSVFGSLTKFIFDNLPELENVPDSLVLRGNMAVLGLLLLKQRSKRVNKDDFTCRYIQSTIRFLRNAYSVEESNEAPSLVISMAYQKDWTELTELWFLGMQTLSSILPALPWICELAVESGWVRAVLEMLKRVKIGSLPANAKCAYEDFLCRLVEANKEVIKLLEDNNAANMCRNHGFTELVAEDGMVAKAILPYILFVPYELGYLLNEKFEVDLDVAEKITGLFLRNFRENRQRPDERVDDWRLSLWKEALSPSYVHLADDVYKEWLLLRYQYVKLSPDVKSLLGELRDKYSLALISNGISDAQWEKIDICGLKPYFDCIVVSGDTPWKKPDVDIFYLACDELNVRPEQCLIIGDRVETDIEGGKNARLAATIWVNHDSSYQTLPNEHNSPDFIVRNVMEVKNVLEELTAKKCQFS